MPEKHVTKMTKHVSLPNKSEKTNVTHKSKTKILGSHHMVTIDKGI